MTLLVGINLSTDVIIAADTRATLHIDNTIIPCSDTERKIIEWDGGAITGCGYVPLLDAIKNRIKNTVIKNNQQISQIIEQETSPYIISSETHNIEKTYIMFNYFSNTGARLAYINVLRPNEMIAINPIDCRLIVPLDNIEEINLIQDTVFDQLVLRHEFTSDEDFKNYYYILMTKLFNEVSSMTNTVSPYFGLYIHNKDYRYLDYQI